MVSFSLDLQACIFKATLMQSWQGARILGAQFQATFFSLVNPLYVGELRSNQLFPDPLLKLRIEQ